MIHRILRTLASLYLTIALIILAMLLIYAGTWAQIDMGIWAVQEKYFHSFFTWVPFQVFLPRPAPGQSGIPGGFPMLGGYAVGLLMLINLLAAHTLRFSFTGRRIGVILIHAGLVLLLAGEGITSGMAVESQMTIDEGSSANYSQDIREAELAIIDPSPASHDRVGLIPAWRLKQKGTVDHEDLPFRIQIDEYYPNSTIMGPRQAGAMADARATAGDGVGITAVSLPPTAGTDSRIDAPSAYISLFAGGQPLGRYLVSVLFDEPQEVKVAGRTYLIELRFKRFYKSYTIHLLEFSHDRYTGTEVAKNFSSAIRLVDPANNEDRPVLIKMNDPLRYRGETFYQSGFKPGDTTTILQVVQNPAWLMPYIACIVGGLGMCIHFGMHLSGFLRRRSAQQAARGTVVSGRRTGGDEYSLSPARPQGALPATALLTIGVLIVTALVWVRYDSRAPGGYDLRNFGRLPVSYEGRVQPLDSVARNSLKVISGREAIKVDGSRVLAIQWLLDTMADRQKAAAYPVFRIDDPGVKGVLNVDSRKKLFSLDDLLPHRRADDAIHLTTQAPELARQFELARAVPRKQRSQFQNAMLEFEQKLGIYAQFSQQLGAVHLAAPLDGGSDWRPIGEALHLAGHIGKVHLGAEYFGSILSAYHKEEPAAFNSALAGYHALLADKLTRPMNKVMFEVLYNRADLMLICIVLYVIVFVLACGSWLGWTRPLQRSAFWIAAIALALHTLALIGRTYISGRPPVTNLASSAIFIAWGAVALALFIEYIWRNGIGSVSAAAVGFLSLLIAQRLSLSGDTMKVLVAVLDTNFWLATHVIVITLGYSAMFLAGVVGIILIVRGVCTSTLTRQVSRELGGMIYGVICFALLFSFLGTVLGGIWADQSWGRFWGWDPKENGAALIVLWCALILHARWAGLIRERGIAILAIGGNIVTAWSWFGTNMLGVGLHAYGFMDSALFWLLMFVLSQIALITLGTLPVDSWRSGRHLSDRQGTA
jgi:ABC-type transport system involved in cytochrome c biogenesis permease subunit